MATTQALMSESDIRAHAAALLRAWNAHDVDAIVERLAEDVVWIEPVLAPVQPRPPVLRRDVDRHRHDDRGALEYRGRRGRYRTRIPEGAERDELWQIAAALPSHSLGPRYDLAGVPADVTASSAAGPRGPWTKGAASWWIPTL